MLVAALYTCELAVMPSRQANDARRSAVDEVERLLQHPEDLKRLPALREEYSQKQQASASMPPQ